jgi:hypothetical protein
VSLKGTLESAVPGIHFAIRGTVRFRRDANCILSLRAARAAALAAAYKGARSVARGHYPNEVFEAEQQIALRLVDWQPVNEYPGLRIRANSVIALIGDDYQRAVQYDESLRAGQLEKALELNRIDYIRQMLADPAVARLWWFERNLKDRLEIDSYEQFEKVVLPLAAKIGVPKDETTRLAEVAAAVVGRLEENPQQQDVLLQVATVLLDKMGWHDLADRIRVLDESCDAHQESPT